MTIADALKKVRQIQIRSGAPEVFETAARDLACTSGAVVLKVARDTRRAGGPASCSCWTLNLERLSGGARPPERVVIRLREDGSGVIADVRHPIPVCRRRVPDRRDRRSRPKAGREGPDVDAGVLLEPAVLRPVPDAGGAHPARPRSRELRAPPGRVRLHTRRGQRPRPTRWVWSSGPKGEVYPMFYTYCPALDQFVYSELNKGLYPFYYLSANLGSAEGERGARVPVRPRARPAVLRAALGARGVLHALPDAPRRARRSSVPVVQAALHDDRHPPARPRALRGDDVEAPPRGAGARLHHRLDERQRIRLRAHEVALRRPERRRLHDPRVEGRRGDCEGGRAVGAEFFCRCCGTPRARSIPTSASSRASSRSTASTTPSGRASGRASRSRPPRSSRAGGTCRTRTRAIPTPRQINGGSVYQMEFAKREQALMADLEGRGSRRAFLLRRRARIRCSRRSSASRIPA